MSSFKTSPDSHRPLVYAHRGANTCAPENTLAAFCIARQQRADGIELDVKLTADGEVVVMHDQTVNRTTNGHGLLRSFHLAELRRLDAGSWFGGAFGGERVQTLALSIPGGVIALKGMAGFLSRSIIGCWFFPKVVIPVYLGLAPNYIQQHKARNRKVIPWTFNDPADIRRMAGWGVDGLITDVPETACKTLEAL